MVTPFLCTVLTAQKGPKITHVLLISIDGMHSQDLANWVQLQPNGSLATLMSTGVNFPNAFTTQPSDSIPSTVGIFTGANASLGGMYYDDAWHRVWAPSVSSGKSCNLGVPNGTAIDLKQGIDFDGTKLDAGGGINPNNLPRDPFNNCNPVYPHNMMRVNTIFEVVRSAGMYTAYSEKRPSYDLLNGPSGTGVNDLYTPEINAVNLLNLGSISDPTSIEYFDQLRVNSILNEVNGMNHDNTAAAPVPNLFGMNFQSVNSAKKESPSSGYMDLTGNTFDSYMLNALNYVDGAIGSIITALGQQGMANSTVVIITAKHGESPLGNTRSIVLTSDIATILNTNNSIATNKITQKTSGLIWLKDQSQTSAAVTALQTGTPADWIPNLNQVLWYNNGLGGLPFPDPTTDPAVPDIVTLMKDGVNFEPSLLKSTTHAEHGGLGTFESHVPLLVSCPRWTPVTSQDQVTTSQIAPTVLAVLNLNPSALMTVQLGAVTRLPAVTGKLQ